MLNVLVVSFCKPVIHKLKVLGGRKLEYYKSMGGPQESGGNQILQFQWGEAKGRNTIFDSNLVGGNLGGNYEYIKTYFRQNALRPPPLKESS